MVQFKSRGIEALIIILCEKQLVLFTSIAAAGAGLLKNCRIQVEHPIASLLCSAFFSRVHTDL